MCRRAAHAFRLHLRPISARLWRTKADASSSADSTAAASLKLSACLCVDCAITAMKSVSDLSWSEHTVTCQPGGDMFVSPSFCSSFVLGTATAPVAWHVDAHKLECVNQGLCCASQTSGLHKATSPDENLRNQRALQQDPFLQHLDPAHAGQANTSPAGNHASRKESQCRNCIVLFHFSTEGLR